ncbi:MAG: M56 family metallopeptidase [Flavobacteriales bacterium]|nr:M56 family metallopeptidase [Flavobacteriales bacterium]
MNDFLRYALLANVSLLMVWAVYRLCLSGITHHSLNRAFLILGSVLAVILPFIPFGSSAVAELVAFRLPEIAIAGDSAPDQNGFSVVSVLPYIYGVGFLAMLLFQLWSFSKLVRVLGSAMRSIVNGVPVARSSEAGPFSFFSFIHIPLNCDAEDVSIILRHEQVHVRQWHSLDVLWLVLLRTVFWFNPILLFLQRDIQTLHEYLADEEAVRHAGLSSYARLQMAHVFGLRSTAFPVNSFSDPLTLKNRITMMYKQKSNSTSMTRYAMIVPVAVGIVFASACVQQPAEQVQEAVHEVFKEAEIMPEYPGGFQAMASELGSSIEYPLSAKQDSVEGTVYVQFVVNKAGKVTDVELLNHLHADLDAEAVRVVSNLKDWAAGQNGGNPVNVQMVLPIKFVLG